MCRRRLGCAEIDTRLFRLVLPKQMTITLLVNDAVDRISLMH